MDWLQRINPSARNTKGTVVGDERIRYHNFPQRVVVDIAATAATGVTQDFAAFDGQFAIVEYGAAAAISAVADYLSVDKGQIADTKNRAAGRTRRTTAAL